jgi:hypothetical protein
MADSRQDLLVRQDLRVAAQREYAELRRDGRETTHTSAVAVLAPGTWVVMARNT